jgi:hypothetical protein
VENRPKAKRGSDSVLKATIRVKEEKITPIIRKKYNQLTIDRQLEIQDSLNAKLCTYFEKNNKDSLMLILQEGASLYSNCSVTRERLNALQAIGLFPLTLGFSAFMKEINYSEYTYTARYIDFVIQSGDVTWLKKIARAEYGWDIQKIKNIIIPDTNICDFLYQEGFNIADFALPDDVVSSGHVERCEYADYTMLRYLLEKGYPVNKVQNDKSRKTFKSTLFSQFMFRNTCDDTTLLEEFIKHGADLKPFDGHSWLEIVLKRQYTGGGVGLLFFFDNGKKNDNARNFVGFTPKQFEYLLTHGVPVSSYPDLMKDLTHFNKKDDWITYFRILKKHNAINFTPEQKAEYIQILQWGNNTETIAMIEKW